MYLQVGYDFDKYYQQFASTWSFRYEWFFYVLLIEFIVNIFFKH